MKVAFKRILVGVDSSPPSARAVRVASSMAFQMAAEVMLVHVVVRVATTNGGGNDSRARLQAGARRTGQALLRRARRGFEPPTVVGESLREGVPADEMLKCAATWEAQLIVVGAHGHSRLGRLILGSTADAVARGAHCPVVTVGDDADAARAVSSSS